VRVGVQRNRNIAGKLPDKHFPAIFTSAAQAATVEVVRLGERDSSFEYSFRRPTNLPKADSEGYGESRYDHPCQALGCMPVDQRLRADAVHTGVQSGVEGVGVVTYFKELGEQTENGHLLARDVLAQMAPAPYKYNGPFPPTNEDEKTARLAAIQRRMR
jgi:hypothetical protein